MRSCKPTRVLLLSVPWLFAGCLGAELAPAPQRATLTWQTPAEQTPEPAPAPAESEAKTTKVLPPLVAAKNRPLPINLLTAMRLAEVAPLDIDIAAQRLAAAEAQLQRANVLWLPTLYLGGDYFRHDGQLQDVGGVVFGNHKSKKMVGAGPSMVFALSDALFAPLAARQDVQARWAGVFTAQNDSLLAVAEAYFAVQQARGQLAGAAEALRLGEELAKVTEKLATGVVPGYEAARVRAELAVRRQAVHSAREAWKTASAELTRVLRLDAAAEVEPVEPPQLQVTLIEAKYGVDDLIPMALTYRPELAAQQALVQATLERLRQERLRPLVPSLLIRGGSTNVTGTLSTGYFGGGKNDDLSKFSW